MFSRLLKPKWEHADPRKRQAALTSEGVPPEAVVKAAREDKDPAVRRCAIERVEDLGLLNELARVDAQILIREAAGRRLRELLVRPLAQGPALADRLETIRQAEAPGLCDFLVKNAEAVEVRETALERITDTGLLCRVAVEDMVRSMRHKALERIDDPQGWEVVSRDARKKDKQISRAARERLEAFRKAQADRETAERLSEELEGLLALEHLQLDSPGQLRRITNLWEKLDSPLPSQLSERFHKAREQATGRIEQFETQLAQRRGICAELETLLERFHDEEAVAPGAPVDLGEAMRKASEQWQKTGPVADEPDAVAQRYSHLLKQLRKTADRQARDAKRAGWQRDLIQKAKVMIENTGHLDESQIKGFQHRWDGLERPESKPVADALQQEFTGLMHDLRERLKKQINQQKQALEEADGLIADLEKALEQGELETALSLRDRAGHRLKKAKGIAEPRRKALQERLNGMHARLEELRKWRHWGSGHAREHLCSEIEALIGSALSPDEIATKVRTARKAWQRIDHAEGPAGEALWQRFDQACTQAYEPYQQERKRQEEILDQHLAQKRTLCGELEEYERNTDWEKVDWREADQHIHKTRERWRRIGAVPRKPGRGLEKSYHQVLDRLESHLAPERERELRRRRALIDRMEELAKAADLRAASREAKEAQDQWKPTVPLARKEEQALWQQFRTACDAVFKQIREERDAADTERKANLQRKREICAELEALLDKPEVKYKEIHKRFLVTQEEWGGIGEIPRKEERAMESRHEMIQGRLAERQIQEKQAAAEALLQGINERAKLCARLENEVLDNTLEADVRQALVEQTEQAWQTLASGDARYDNPMRARYELAARALSGDEGSMQSLQSGLPENLARRLELCLQLEVANGVESPAEYAEERMQYQVSRLSDALHQKFEEEQTQEDQLRDLQIAWFQAGPVQRDAQQGLERRFERALAKGIQFPEK
ncbi:MAG: DUF349 domain-containing protein [Pseudomonadota bacterium]